MKRKSFFKRLILGAVAIWKAPEILASVKKEETFDEYCKKVFSVPNPPFKSNPMLKKIEYSNKWFEDNYSWLRKWVENYRVQSWKKRGKHLSNDEYFDGMSIFSNTVGLTSGRLLLQKRIKNELRFLEEKHYEEHVKTVVRAAVFSKQVKYVLQSEEGNRRIDCMSGFVEQMGRLPIKSDKVRFVTCSDDAKGSRFLRIRYAEIEGSDTITFLSDCRLEILGVKPEQRKKTWYSPKITEQGIELITGARF